MNPTCGLEDESDLVRRLRDGDDAAAETVVRTHGARMLAAARRILRSEADAQGAVQDAFLCAFRSIGNFQACAGLGTWLHRIVINAALMKLRTARRKPETSIEQLLPVFDETGHHVVPIHGWGGCAEQALLQSEALARVRALIDRLPENYRTVLLLREVEELSTEETAAVLGVTTTAVKLRLHRARQALRTMIDAEVIPGDRAARRPRPGAHADGRQRPGPGDAKPRAVRGI